VVEKGKIMKKRDIETIKKIYANEWVLLADYEVDEFNEPLSGVVIAHSQDRDEIYNRQMEIKRDLLILYTGEVPEDLAIMF
jgi:hypothetical protein